MRQLSPLTHRSSIRFCTQSCGGKNKKDFGFGGSAHPEQRLNRASIADRSIHRRLLLHRETCSTSRDLSQPLPPSNPLRGSRSSRRYASFWRGIKSVPLAGRTGVEPGQIYFSTIFFGILMYGRYTFELNDGKITRNIMQVVPYCSTK